MRKCYLNRNPEGPFMRSKYGQNSSASSTNLTAASPQARMNLAHLLATAGRQSADVLHG